MIGRVVSVGSLTVVVVSLGTGAFPCLISFAVLNLSFTTGLYILSTAYGAYAVREFLGPE